MEYIVQRETERDCVTVTLCTTWKKEKDDEWFARLEPRSHIDSTTLVSMLTQTIPYISHSGHINSISACCLITYYCLTVCNYVKEDLS